MPAFLNADLSVCHCFSLIAVGHCKVEHFVVSSKVARFTFKKGDDRHAIIAFVKRPSTLAFPLSIDCKVFLPHDCSIALRLISIMPFCVNDNLVAVGCLDSEPTVIVCEHLRVFLPKEFLYVVPLVRFKLFRWLCPYRHWL